jgi:hypothetical protein
MTTAEAIENTLVSPNEHDRNLEPANVVDGLFAIARAIHRIADVLEAKPYIPEALQKAAAAEEYNGE